MQYNANIILVKLIILCKLLKHNYIFKYKLIININYNKYILI